MRIPTYDAPQVATNAAPATMLRQPDGPSGQQVNADQLQRAGQALQSAGGAAGAIAQDMAKDANAYRHNAAMTQLANIDTDLRVEALSLKGRNALERPDGKSLPDEFGERLQKEAQAISDTLANPEQKRMFAQSASHMGVQFRSALSSHMVQQFQVDQDEEYAAAVNTGQRRGSLLWGDEKVRGQSVQAITRAVDAFANRKGMSPEARDAALADALSPLHVGVMKGMIQAGQASQAKAYYDENSAGMTLQARASMQGVIKEASDTQAGEAGADSVWARLGPQDVNQPVKIFDMERELRESMKDNPDAMKRGVDALRQRAQAFNAQQAETNAAGVNSVFRLIDAGAPMSTIQRSAEWLALPDLKKHEIRQTMKNEAAQAEARAMTHDQRVLTRMQLDDKKLLLGNGDAYMRYSDPEVLSKMTRQQVEATRTVFGLEGAQHLLQRFDSLIKNPTKIAEARLDKQDFENMAEQMGLDPFNAKSPEAKKRLGDLQYSIEQLIDVAQASKKGELTRAEKRELINTELARKVTVPGFFKDSQVPVINLTGEDAARVVVPQEDRAQIAQALQVMAQTDPKNPAYAPTEDNVRRLYLMRQSRASAFIPPKKP